MFPRAWFRSREERHGRATLSRNRGWVRSTPERLPDLQCYRVIGVDRCCGRAGGGAGGAGSDVVVHHLGVVPVDSYAGVHPAGFPIR